VNTQQKAALALLDAVEADILDQTDDVDPKDYRWRLRVIKAFDKARANVKSNAAVPVASSPVGGEQQ
jgi:hypothetical protein